MRVLRVAMDIAAGHADGSDSVGGYVDVSAGTGNNNDGGERNIMFGIENATTTNPETRSGDITIHTADASPNSVLDFRQVCRVT